MDVQGLFVAMSTGAVDCPHPEARKAQTIYVRPDRQLTLALVARHPLLALRRLFQPAQSMALCGYCKKTFDRLIYGWERGQVTRAQIREVMVEELGYEPQDAEEFIADLEAEYPVLVQEVA